MRLSLFFQTSLQCEIRFALDMLRFSLASSLRLFAGGHRGVVTPVPIPNTEVKGSFAEGSAGLARARVGRRRLFYFLQRVCLHSSNGKPAAPIGRTPARASPSATHCVRGIFRLFFFHTETDIPNRDVFFFFWEASPVRKGGRRPTGAPLTGHPRADTFSSFRVASGKPQDFG